MINNILILNTIERERERRDNFDNKYQFISLSNFVISHCNMNYTSEQGIMV